MMTRRESTRAIIGAVVGFSYGSILARMSFLALGAGHGSFVPFFLSSALLGVLGLFGEPGSTRRSLAERRLSGQRLGRRLRRPVARSGAD